MCKRDKLTRGKIISMEIEEILRHKYIMSEKAGRDMGEEAVLDWIEKYAESFRNYWEKKLKEQNDEK